jgi:hypothetical protein
LLRAGILQMLGADRARWSADTRDLLVALVPYYDCARRLGIDPAELFGQVAKAGPPELLEAVRDFGRRDDVTLAAFGWTVVETPDGPRYDFS